jgi:hypothetical protein
VPDVLVRFTSSCGVLYDSDGLPALEGNRLAVRSNAQGVADVAVAVDEGTACTNRVSVTIEAVLEDEPDTVVARTSVSANVFSGAVPSVFGTYVGRQVCTITGSTGSSSTCTAANDAVALSERFNSAGNPCGKEICISPPRGCIAQRVFSADVTDRSSFDLSFFGTASVPTTRGTTLEEQLSGTVTLLDTPPRVVLSQDGEERLSNGSLFFGYSCTFEGEKLP